MKLSEADRYDGEKRGWVWSDRPGRKPPPWLIRATGADKAKLAVDLVLLPNKLKTRWVTKMWAHAQHWW